MDLSCIAGKEGERKTSSDNGYIQHVIQIKVYKIMSVSASRNRGRYNRLGTQRGICVMGSGRCGCRLGLRQQT